MNHTDHLTTKSLQGNPAQPDDTGPPAGQCEPHHITVQEQPGGMEKSRRYSPGLEVPQIPFKRFLDIPQEALLCLVPPVHSSSVSKYRI